MTTWTELEEAAVRRRAAALGAAAVACWSNQAMLAALATLDAARAVAALEARLRAEDPD